MFLKEEDLAHILERLWFVGKGSLVLNRWWVDLDLGHSRVLKRHLWVLLSNLPFALWTQDSSMDIGYCLGRFIVVDELLFHSFDKRMAKVFVELDTSEGLPKDMDITWGDKVLVQRLYYYMFCFGAMSSIQWVICNVIALIYLRD